MPFGGGLTARSMTSVKVGSVDCWMIDFDRGDGKGVHQIVMPTTSVAVCAAEYGLDPVADIDQVLELLLVSMFVADPNDTEEDVAADPAANEGYTTTVQTLAGARTVAATLHTAETVQDAREAQLIRCRAHTAAHGALDVGALRASGVRSKLREHAARVPASVAQRRREEVTAERRTVRGRGDGRPLRPKKTRSTATEGTNDAAQ